MPFCLRLPSKNQDVIYWHRNLLHSDVMAHRGRNSLAASVFLCFAAGISLLARGPVAFAGTKSLASGSLARLRPHGVARRAAEAGIDELAAAAHAGDEEKLVKLLKGGADVDHQDDYGWTPLRYAVRANQRSAAYMLIEAGANINLASKSGRTPLMSAAGNKLNDMVRMLLDAGADKTLKDSSGLTAYNIALRGGGTGCPECRALLEF
eukprot:TRINITY_DN83328_c0_g1_i1.p1 TRINITY_DN83328_c0_g1~~TRINITY_DN83328_c0_g1_i1.p1  ORF type:complete len:208 (+),score=28.88 TRINITY_DN83328_c0_g1_i1:101-724(+)